MSCKPFGLAFSWSSTECGCGTCLGGAVISHARIHVPEPETAINPPGYWRSAPATFSPDQLYRYSLHRTGGDKEAQEEGNKRVTFIMLNPSTADAKKNDPTIRRVMGFNDRWHGSDLYVGNIFAYRSTDPKGLRGVTDPIGEDNEQVLREMVQETDTLILAWGTHGHYRNRGQAIMDMVLKERGSYRCFGFTTNGQPKHPLMLPYGQPIYTMDKQGFTNGITR